MIMNNGKINTLNAGINFERLQRDQKIPVICNSAKQEISESMNSKTVHHQKTKAEDS